MKSIIIRILNRINYYIFLGQFERALFDTKGQSNGNIELFDEPFYYHNGRSFYSTYDELFRKDFYKFKSDAGDLIIDCGANMGLSLLYFSKYYPDLRIIAFEPDKYVLSTLERNLNRNDMSKVKLYKKAVWDSETSLKFFSDRGMSGRVSKSFGEPGVETKTVRLKNFLKGQKVALLKLDIEGAEFRVLKDCIDELKNVDNLFVEYHSLDGEEQFLGEILQILKQQGFRYQLKDSFSRKKPFVNKTIICEAYDLTINIFAYR